MRMQLLGLELRQAESILDAQGIHPQVTVTDAAPAGSRRRAGRCAWFTHRMMETGWLLRGFLTRFQIRRHKYVYGCRREKKRQRVSSERRSCDTRFFSMD